MASHGVPRGAGKQERTAEARQHELQAIEEYQTLVGFVHDKVDEKDFSPELLEKTGALLQRNPEYYTIWNIRRRIYANEFKSILSLADNNKLSQDAKIKQILDIIQLDLQFLFPLLLKFPKCYWIWNHRIWLLQQSSILLPTDQARAIWQTELGLVGKMLTRDSRNYHGWGYRRFIVSNLEDPALEGQSMAREEFDYTTKMIGNNLSNFSAWHNRTKLILRFLEEEKASNDERRQILDEELRLIHDALFDPYDQSLWFYHQMLMSTFDPNRSQDSIAPHLSRPERQSYIENEKKFIAELLEDAEDCKWAYQALIECALIEGQLHNGLPETSKLQVLEWLTNLKRLDPLRFGRWQDMGSCLSA